MRTPLAWTGTVRTLSGWLAEKGLVAAPGGAGPIAAFGAAQDALQAHFQGQLATIANPHTRRVMSKMLGRCGKLVWAASMSSPGNLHRFNGWSMTTRRSSGENTKILNCWEGVLYAAYQAEQITVAKCRALYNAYNAADQSQNIRDLFGVANAWGGGGAPQMGDVMTFGPAANNINHVAFYAGLHGGQHYVLHQLSCNAATTGILTGCIHFEPILDYLARPGAGNAWFNTPFWEAGAPTHAYYAAL